jgi:hypothetical protein
MCHVIPAVLCVCGSNGVVPVLAVIWPTLTQQNCLMKVNIGTRMLIWMNKITPCRDLTAAVTKPAPLVLFADPQKAITRSGYIYMAYQEQNVRPARKTRIRQANKIIPCLLRKPLFDM